ncbi:MAG: 1-deoxy-D-xylulose-5-phosphate reductoisomerase [Gammaproteobacteria bacterium]|nr:1-deoxy-D-xylulose-5-phosphate reductoisomerase [Gammaproteobacteria bacterium]
MASQGITVLGSTGSIGESTLDVLARHPDRYHAVALSAHSNMVRLAEQCLQHNARYAVVSDKSKARELKSMLDQLKCKSEILAGRDALGAVACMDETDAVMAAIVGAAGLEPTLQAVQAGKRLLLANKESMVIAGELFRKAAAEHAATIIPVDSEHNALFQVLPENFQDGLENLGVERLTLTASGGPFLHRERSSLVDITPDQACSHPNWDMGRKISVDSATLMNKGLEVIEARWLFNARPDQIDVIVHPQSIVHSMVTYLDGSVLAQLGMPDMRTPIAYALAWPQRVEAGVKRLHLTDIHKLEFYPPDLESFPGLALAFQVLEAGDNAPVIFNAANEIAVEAFLQERIGFLQIPSIVSAALDVCKTGKIDGLDDILEYDRLAREATGRLIHKNKGI